MLCEAAFHLLFWPLSKGGLSPVGVDIRVPVAFSQVIAGKELAVFTRLFYPDRARMGLSAFGGHFPRDVGGRPWGAISPCETDRRPG